MIVQVIPAIKLPRNTRYFSYQVPLAMQKKIKIGQIVEINFRNKQIYGLITKIEKNISSQAVAKKYPYPLKNITKILCPQKLITLHQIKLIEHISKTYGVAPSLVTNSMLPIIPKKIKNIKIHRISKTKNTKQKYSKKIIWYKCRKKIFKKLKTKVQNQSGQILIIVPEIELIEKITQTLRLKKNEYLIHTSHVTLVESFKNWLKILSGKKNIIIGTKISIFLPFNNLTEIIIFDSQNWNHKQSDINPRFDARDIAEWLAQKHKCKLSLLTPAPNVENFKTQEFKKKNKLKKKNIKLIDLRAEKFKGNYTFLSDELLFTIDNLLKNNKKICIFHNRKGLANYIFCKDCQYIFKCPECAIPLVYHTADKMMHCRYCNFKKHVTPLCPKCSSPKIEFNGQGIEKIKSEIQKEFKNTPVLIFNKSTKTKKVNLNKFNIIIGTEFMLNKINFSEFDVIAFTNFDQLLNRPDFRTQEKAFQLLNQILSQTSANILIQTNLPENIVLESVLSDTPEKFYKTELKNRQILKYPPFIKIIKLFHLGKTDKKTFNASQKLILKLKENFAKKIEILGPFENYPKKIRGKYKYNIILKVPLNFDTSKIFKLIPNDFIIDVEPENLN